MHAVIGLELCGVCRLTLIVVVVSIVFVKCMAFSILSAPSGHLPLPTKSRGVCLETIGGGGAGSVEAFHAFLTPSRLLYLMLFSSADGKNLGLDYCSMDWMFTIFFAVQAAAK